MIRRSSTGFHRGDRSRGCGRHRVTCRRWPQCHSGGVEAVNSWACGSGLQVEPADVDCFWCPGSPSIVRRARHTARAQSVSVTRNAWQTAAESILDAVRHCPRVLCDHPRAYSAQGLSPWTEAPTEETEPWPKCQLPFRLGPEPALTPQGDFRSSPRVALTQHWVQWSKGLPPRGPPCCEEPKHWAVLRFFPVSPVLVWGLRMSDSLQALSPQPGSLVHPHPPCFLGS